MPIVLLPAAAPAAELLLEAVADAFVQVAYVYLFRSVPVDPSANIPIVLFPAAAPIAEVFAEAVAAALVQLEYVYLFLVEVGSGLQHIYRSPNANIPTVLLPTAAPARVAVLAAAAIPFVSPEYVYIFRVVENALHVVPKANIPRVLFPVAAPNSLAALAAVAEATTHPL